MRSVSATIKLGHFAFVRRQRLFQQLRRAANAGQRILDLMRQHRRHAVHRTHRAARHQLAIHALGQAAFLQGDHQRAFRLGQRRHRHIGDAFAMPRGGKIDIAFGGGGIAFPRLDDQLEQRAVERQQVADDLLEQEAGAGIEELLGSGIDVDDFLTRARSAGSAWAGHSAIAARGWRPPPHAKSR